ncbi:MAG: SDR family oxidoreductase [Chitinispirillaceae bacterium]|jgi:NAD(P)-dependent dehydrogenase (short-subunit alcohol dehydrogenase family)
MTEKVLRGTTALVTGATGRIGREIALSLAAEGVNIIAHYLRSRKETMVLCREIEKRGATAWPLDSDFMNARETTSLIHKAARLSGTIDILINSASLFTESTIPNLTSTDLAANLQVNAWVPFLLGREFKRIAGKGSIVNLLDTRIAGGDRSHAGYIVSKHALMALTKMMAIEFAPRISVNAVAPGLILPASGSNRRSISRMTRNIPLRQYGEPDDVARAVIFLIKSGFITGQVVWVDGGRHLREYKQGYDIG